MNLKLMLGAGMLAGALAFGSMAATSAQLVPPQAVGVRYDHHSDRNVAYVARRLEELVDHLNRDQHDYGGHRVKAIALMQQAREQLRQAEQYDASRGR